MEKSLSTRLKIASWDEDTVDETSDASRVVRAQSVLCDGTDGITAGRSDSVMYYRPDGTSQWASVWRLEGVLDGMSGSFALLGTGSFDGTTATEHSIVVPGSGTEGLVGISGACVSVSTQADYPYVPITLTYSWG